MYPRERNEIIAGNALEYRWGSTSNLQVRNNLANQRIRSRDGASAQTSNNLENAQSLWFANVATGDLHLSSCSIAELDATGTTLADVTDDFDEEPRDPDNDIGADQCY